jgi:hypothetical protein
MKHFIFYTTEGQTQDDNGQDIENCQILDFQDAETLEDAVAKFKEEFFTTHNDYYSFNEVLVKETVNDAAYTIYLKDDTEIGTCFNCGEDYELSELKQETNLGPLCDSCIRALRSRGEELTIIE